MTRGTMLALAAAAVGLLAVPPIIDGEFYINMAT